jgi:hypothetical protein
MSSNAATAPAPGAARASLQLLAAFAAVKLALHLWAGEGYGWFRDELYYVACSDHLAWGYVDQPPLSIALLKLWRLAFGDSLVAIRMFAAIAGAATIVTTGWMARVLGGGPFAQALAMTAALIVPVHLALTGFYSMNAFDLLLWTLAAAVLVKIFAAEPQAPAAPTRLWLLFGAIVGLGLMNKWSTMWFAGAVGLGLLLTPQRRHLRSRGPWLAAGLAVLIFLPHAVWQAAHGGPTFEFIRNATGGKMLAVTPLEFAGGQVMSMHPLTLPVWLAGLVWLLRDRRMRALGIAFIAVVLLLVLNGTSRASYLAPAYTMLFAAGGVALARTLLPERLPLLRGAAIGVLLAGGAALAPLALPLLPVDAYVAWAARLGRAPSTEERKELGRLPQHFADMHGWEDIVAEVARVYHALPAADRARVSIFTYNYGEAGAIDVLGRRHGLPPAVSGHNNYWLWGTRGRSGEVLIVIGGTREGHLRVFESAEPAGVTDCGDCMPYENHQTIWVLRGPRYPVADVWPQLRHYE